MKIRDWKLKDKKLRLKELSTRDRLKLIYGWVKAGDINLKEFVELITEVQEETEK